MDLNFDKILEELKEIHKDKPNMRFGQVVQTALDLKKKTTNLDFHDINSKEILNALKYYKEKINRGEL